MKTKTSQGTPKQKVLLLAKELGADIETYKTEDGMQIDVIAPEGYRWSGGPGVLCARYAGTWGPANEAWSDIHERMMFGLEEDEP